jgi:hypothetical protein
VGDAVRRGRGLGRGSWSVELCAGGERKSGELFRMRWSASAENVTLDSERGELAQVVFRLGGSMVSEEADASQGNDQSVSRIIQYTRLIPCLSSVGIGYGGS